MAKFFVQGFVDVTKSGLIEAETAEAALEKAHTTFKHPSLCHQCSEELDCGEFYDWEVLDESQENTLIDRQADADEDEGTDIKDASTEELEEAVGEMRKLLDEALAELARRKTPVIPGRQKKGLPS